MIRNTQAICAVWTDCILLVYQEELLWSSENGFKDVDGFTRFQYHWLRENILWTITYMYVRIRDISVCIATGYGLDGRGSMSIRGKFFIYSTAFRPTLVSTQPPIQWVQGALSLGIKWTRRETDYSPPSSAEVNNAVAVPPLSHTSSWCGT
jgi:hypothetical protein